MGQLETDAQGQQGGSKQPPHHLCGLGFIEVIPLWVSLRGKAFDFLSGDSIGTPGDKRIANRGIFKIFHGPSPFLIGLLGDDLISSGEHHRSVDAIQIPTKTATIPTIRLTPIVSPITKAAMSEAVIGLTVMVLATRVGVVRSRAYTHR